MNTSSLSRLAARRTFAALSFVTLAVSLGAVMARGYGAFVPFALRAQAGAAPLTARAPEGAGPSLLLHDGRQVAASYAGPSASKSALEDGRAKPLALATYDFDADGATDLVAGYAVGRGGAIAVHRGDPSAFGPTDPDVLRGIAKGHYPDPYLRDATVYELPEQPDFVATGDVDRDGSVDVVAAARGSRALYVLAGDGRGGFAAPTSVALAGEVTALEAGDVGRLDGRADVVVGVSDGGRSSVYVYDGPEGVLGAPPAIDVAGEVTSIAIAALDDDGMADVAIVAGGDLFVARNGAAAPAPARVPLAVQARSVVAGEFVRDRDGRPELAVLATDGSVSVLARDDLDTRPMTHDEIVARRLATAPQAPAKAAGDPPAWHVAETVGSVAKAAAAGSGRARLVRAHVSTEASEDLLVVDPSSNKVHVLSAPTLAGAADELSFASDPRTDVAIDVSAAPAAALATRVSVDGRQGIVLLGQGGSAPAVVFPKIAATFTVTKTADTNDGTCDGDCSLREAIGAANANAGADTVMIPAGTYTLTITGRDENANATGDLDVTDTTTILGAGSASTIIQAGTNATNGIDKIMSFNPNFSTALAESLSGFTMQFGRNTSSAVGDGYGGAFDHEFLATGSLSITNCVVTQNTTTTAFGGGGAFTSTGGTNGVLTTVNTIFSSNTCVLGGGAVFAGTGTSVHATAATFQNNSISSGTNNGGGVLLVGSPNPSSPTFFHACTISGNQSTNDGGGVFSTQPITLDQSSDVVSNTASRNGGGVWLNHTNASSTIDHCTIRNNSATSAGGGVRLDSADTTSVLNMHFCRIVDNTATSATGLSVLNGAANADNNWWGCNQGPTNAACDTAVLSGAGTLDFTPWIVLTVTSTPTSVLRGQTTALTASFLMNSAGQTLTTGQISELIGLPVAWTATNGTISSPENAIQSDGMANATYNATTIGAGSATATVDGFGATVNITVLNNPPTIAAGGPLTRQQGSPGTSSQIASVSDADQAANTLTVTATPPSGITVTGISIDASGNVTATVAASCTATLGANTVPLTVMDSNGGSASANLTVNVTANTPPTLGTYPDTSVAAGAGTTVTPSAAPTDNGTVSSVTAVATTPAGFTGTLSGDATTGVITVTNANPPAVYTITVTATDNCGDTSTATFQLTVVPPCTVTCPANVTQSNDVGVCGAVVNYAQPTTTGTCGTVTCAPASGSLFAIGVTTVTCTSSVGGGSCSFTVTVNDTQAPTVTCPANVTQPAAAGTCAATVTYTTPTAADNCPGATVSCLPASGTSFPVGVTTVTCTATDSNSNTGTCSFTVTVNDTQAPTVTCPANVTQSAAAGQCAATVTYTTPTATDNCSGVGAVSCLPASGTSFAVGVTTVTCSVTDAANNSGSCTFTITVNDTQAPTVTCPANVTQPAATGACMATVTYTTPTASDNCSGATVSCLPASGTSFPVGVTTVTCTATDASSNTGTCSFTVTITDNQAPTVTCPANQTAVESPAQSGSATVTYPAPTVNDNCPGATASCLPASGSSFPVGVTTVTCTATDASSNTGTCSFTVTVTPACAITCPANVTVGNMAGQCGAAVNYAAPTTTGNCGTVTCLPASGSFFPKGTTTVTCSTTTGPSCSFTVTVNDTEAPLVSCPKNPIAMTAPGQCTAPVTYTVDATDNCPGVTVVCVPASGSTFPVGTTTVTCTATDAAANTASCSFTVRVNDAQVPTIACPANVTTPAPTGQCSAPVAYAAPTASDNCGVASVTCVPASGSTFAVGTTTVTCTATDTSGNTASCGFTVTVVDTQAPTITCPSSTSSKASTRGANDCSLTGVVTYPAPTVTDNCPGATVVCVPASGSVFPEGTTTVTCTATDASGNTASCGFTVTVSVSFGTCVVDDATGDTFSIVNDVNDPLYGLWRYRVAATGQVLCGTANHVAYIPNRSLTASDTDDPTVSMQATINFASSTATVQVRDRSTNKSYVLRDRNLRNDPPCQ